MKRARIALMAIVFLAIAGGALAFKLSTKRLYYKLSGVCMTRSFVTTIPNASPTVLPSGAVGWFVNSGCSGSTFGAYTIGD